MNEHKHPAFLEAELKTYEQNKERLIREHTGKFVLIKGTEIIDIFESQEDAIKMGISKFGNVPFLVKKIEKVEQVLNFTSNLIQY